MAGQQSERTNVVMSEGRCQTTSRPRAGLQWDDDVIGRHCRLPWLSGGQGRGWGRINLNKELVGRIRPFSRAEHLCQVPGALNLPESLVLGILASSRHRSWSTKGLAQ